MKKFFVSAGLAAFSAAAIESCMADNITGPKYWTVGATLRGFYDSDYNIQNNGQGSFGIELLPDIAIHVPLQQTDLGIRYTYGLYWYEDRSELGIDPIDQTHEVDIWVDHAFNERWKGNLTDNFAVGQEPELLSPNPTTAVATPYRVGGDNLSNHGTFSLNTDWTRLLTTTVTYNNGYFDFDNSGTIVNPFTGALTTGGFGGPSLAGTLNRDEESASLDVKWHLQPETVIFAGYAFSWVNYLGNEPIAVAQNAAGQLITTPSFSGIYHSSDRDSFTHYAYLGLEEDFLPNLTGTIRAGASYTDVYSDPLNDQTSWGPYADISLSWTYIPGSYLQFGFTQNVGATDQVAPNTAGQITLYANDSVIYVDINHRFTPKLIGTVIGRMQYSSYQGGAVNSLNTTDYSLGVNLTYQINGHFSVDTGYNYDDVISEVAGYSYDRSRVYLGVSFEY